MSLYQAKIKELSPASDPRHVEGYMRLEHGTLDQLSTEQIPRGGRIGGCLHCRRRHRRSREARTILRAITLPTSLAAAKLRHRLTLSASTAGKGKGKGKRAIFLPLTHPPPQGFVALGLPCRAPTRKRAGPRRARPCPGGREGAFGTGLQKTDPKEKAATNG